MVKKLLQSLRFLHNKCSLGLVTSLNTDYSAELHARATSMAERKWAAAVKEVEEFALFVYKSAHLLLRLVSAAVIICQFNIDSDSRNFLFIFDNG